MDVASSLEVNHVKSVCCATVHVIVLYLLLSAIYYMSLVTVNECMYAILQFTVT